VTKSVTPTDALVLSPVGLPEDPARAKDVFDVFARAVAGLEDGLLATGWQDGMRIVAHASTVEPVFRPTPLLRDGTTFSDLVPELWDGRVTRDVVASYFDAGWLLRPRERGWGVRTEIVEGFWEGLPQGSYMRVRTDWPLVDPVGDAAQFDDEAVDPISARKPEPWDGLLTDWEHRDGYFGGVAPGTAWLARRSAHVRALDGRWWWQLRGLREGSEPVRFRGQWDEPVAVSVYLGWPAYMCAVAGTVTRCAACGVRFTIGGRRYCGSTDCVRARASDRQRIRRRGLKARRD